MPEILSTEVWTITLTGHFISAGSLFELYPLRALNKYSQRFSVFQKINDLQTGDLDMENSHQAANAMMTKMTQWEEEL